MFPLDPIAWLDPQFLRAATANLEHGRGRSTAWNGSFIQGLGGRDPADSSVGPNENHIERNERVLHPERNVLRRLIGKDHAVIWRKGAPEHETNLLLLGSGGDLNGEPMRAGGGMDDERHLAKTRLRMRNGLKNLRKGRSAADDEHSAEQRDQSSAAPVGRSSMAVRPLPLGAIRA